MDISSSVNFIVDDSALDCFGHARASTLSGYMQVASNVSADSLGFGIAELLKRNYSWMVARMSFCFDDLPKVGDEVVSKTWPAGIKGHLICLRDYELYVGGRRILRATSEWVMVDMVRRKIARLLPEFVDRLDFKDIPRSGVEPAEKMDFEDGRQAFRAEVGVRRSDLDINGHVNNIHYLDWLFECLPPEAAGRRIARIDIDYRAEAREGDVVASEAQVVGDATIHRLTRASDGSLLTSAACHWRD